MLYETRARGEAGQVLTVKVEDDSLPEGGYLIVSRNDISHDICSIAFDILVEEKYRIALADGFAKYSYRSPRDYLDSVGFPLGETLYPTFFQFSMEDALFAKRLEAEGLDIEIATRIAFYTQDFTEKGLDSTREEDLDHFMARNFGVRIENRPELAGFTTIDVYLLARQRASRAIADYLVGESRGVPSALALRLNSLGTLISRGVAIDTLSLSQLGALSSVVDSGFPEKERDSEKAEIITRAIANFIIQPHNLKEAPKILRRRGELKRILSNELMRLIDHQDSSGYGSQKLGNEQTAALASIFIATYGEELMTKALAGFKAQEHILQLNSSYAFSAFVAYVIHLSSGGDEATPIHFVLALEPDIDDSIINRGDWTEYED